MSNSPLVVFKQLTPNHSGARTHKIDTITPHCVVGHLSLQTLANVFAPPSRRASSNYGIDDNGQIGMFVEEKNRSWCTSSNANDQRAITIEIASDTRDPYRMTNGAIDGLIKLSVDICQRNNIPKLLWKADKSLIGRPDLQNITVHRWFDPRQCPGDYLYNRLGEVADSVNKILLSSPIITHTKKHALPYRVKISQDMVYYRRGPGNNYLTNGFVRKGEIYTITEESSDSKWGRLKSGAGWLPLDGCDVMG